jgi:MFS family permease
MMAGATRRNVAVLAFCQALNATALTLMIASSALTGQLLAGDAALATLPLGLQFLTALATTFPMSLLMRRHGRRWGFTLGAATGAVGGFVMMQAVLAGSFLGFCIGNALIGVTQATAQFYRFAAADAADERFKGKAISLVLAGGVVAALVGPELAKWSRLYFSEAEFAASFGVVMGLAILTVVIVQFVRIPRPTEAELAERGRSWGELFRQPTLVIAVAGGMIGYGTMTLVMTSTPLAMVHHQHAFDDAAFVIQWHILGMFVPSFFTGHLIQRFGVVTVILAGFALLAGCVAVNLTGTSVPQFWAALVLLGLGWNFAFVGSSTLLTETYRPSERARVQALHDLMVGIAIAGASFSSGWLHSHFGWQAVNLGVVLPLAAVSAAMLWLRGQRERIAAARPAE